MGKSVGKPFSGYQKFVVFILALTQFTVILDFMVMSPLGDMLMKSLSLKPAAFGSAVSAYAFSAGISGLLTAGFADRYDRKKLLLFFYSGFIVGTIFCGLAGSYLELLSARIFTGIFGGVIGSIGMAIITDLFKMEQRGRVMGFVQMGFGASQVLGIPIGLYLANYFGWEAPFFLVAGIAVVVGLAILVYMKPVNAHLSIQREKTIIQHLWQTVTNRNYRIGFASIAFMSIGGFMMMPFGSAYAINNLHVTNEQLPLLFMVSGIFALVMMPFIGRLADRIDKLKIFAFASLWLMVVVVIYTNLPPIPFWLVVLFNVMVMMGILNRFVPSTALMSAVPDPADRGSYMSISSSIQQIAGGIAAMVTGMIVIQKDKYSPLEHYNTVGYVVCGISILSIYLLYRVKEMIGRRQEAVLA